MADINIIIDFTDITLAQTDGKFKDVKKIMIQYPPYNEKWVIRSNITISSESGVSNMEIQCHGDGSIYILNYVPSIKDVYYNYDIIAISEWAQQNGWRVPQPLYSLVQSDEEFWKHFYDTMIVDSDYLDGMYGKRPQLE